MDSPEMKGGSIDARSAGRVVVVSHWSVLTYVPSVYTLTCRPPWRDIAITFIRLILNRFPHSRLAALLLCCCHSDITKRPSCLEPESFVVPQANQLQPEQLPSLPHTSERAAPARPHPRLQSVGVQSFVTARRRTTTMRTRRIGRSVCSWRTSTPSLGVQRAGAGSAAIQQRRRHVPARGGEAASTAPGGQQESQADLAVECAAEERHSQTHERPPSDSHQQAELCG